MNVEEASCCVEEEEEDEDEDRRVTRSAFPDRCESITAPEASQTAYLLRTCNDCKIVAPRMPSR
jgi:hypothetical protein